MGRKLSRSALSGINEGFQRRRAMERLERQPMNLKAGEYYTGKAMRGSDGGLVVYAGSYIVNIVGHHSQRRVYPGDFVRYHVFKVDGDHASATAERV